MIGANSPMASKGMPRRRLGLTVCVALGLLLAHDGNWRGHQLIPAPWIMDATTVRADQPHLRPGTATPIFGYGYQTWILPTMRRMFMLWASAGSGSSSIQTTSSSW